jgi:FKBP-type peptidyl-prolyl cis-trans isomerase
VASNSTMEILTKADLKICSGPVVRPGDYLVMLYKAALSERALETGDWVESTYGPDVPVEIRFTREDLLPGVYEGVLGMRAGGSIRRLSIPPSLAYGQQGFGLVPPDADLYVDVCLARISRRE